VDLEKRHAMVPSCRLQHLAVRGGHPMTTEDFIGELFYRVDEAMKSMSKHPLANLWPSEIVTLGVLFAPKGSGNRAFYRWLSRDGRPLFPALPERTRLFRLLATHRACTDEFLATPSVLGVIDSYGVALLHPRREGRSIQQIGRKGKANPRWLVGGKLCVLLNKLGLVVAWDGAEAAAPDTAFHPLIETFEDARIVLSDSAFHAKEGDPANLRLGARGLWNTRMLVETVLSIVTGVCHLKKVAQRTWAAFQTRLAFTLATFNLLAQWHGLTPDAQGFVHLSLAEFSL
jgi:hypothetical protein